MDLAPFTFVCPRCRYRNNMEIESDDAWIQVAHWKRDGRCWECAYRFDPLEVIAAFEAREKRHAGANTMSEQLKPFRCEREAYERMEATLTAEIERLRRIAAHVPAAIYIKAKEAAGYGDAVRANEKGQRPCE